MTNSTLDAVEAQVQAQTGHKPGQRVTLDHIKSLVVEDEFHRPNHTPHMTICTLKLKNGFVVLGTSTPADPQKFDSALGVQLSFDDALRKVWPFEGYLLRDRISRDEGITVKMGTATETDEKAS